MSWDEQLKGLNLRALLLSVLVATAALTALTLLIDRFERVALSKPIAERNWSAPAGMELRLSGLDEGPLVGVETSPGGGLTVSAQRASLATGSDVRRILWMSRGDSQGDNKSQVQVRIIGRDGSVALSRSGEAETPQLRIRVENAKLQVNSGVTIGDAFKFPVTRIVFGQQELPPSGMGFSFIVPEGGSVAIDLPAFPDGTPSGVVPWLGGVREEQKDTLLSVREMGIAREGAVAPDKAVCATNRRYAWGIFFRPTLFPVPTGRDCAAGSMTARNLLISRDSVAVSLSGSAWHMVEGMPTDSLWSWAKSNDVLSLVINKLLPGAVGLIFGIFTWRRRTASAEPTEPKKTPGKTRAAKQRSKRAA